MSEEDLKKLSCHFTWDLQKEDADLNFLEVKFCERLTIKCEYGENLKHRDLNFFAFIKHLQGFNDKALKNLELAKEEHPGNEQHLIVTYGNLAWVHSLMGNVLEAKTCTEKVNQILKAFPAPSPTELHREVQSEKAWSLLKFSRKSYIRAKETFHEALQKEPDDKEWNTGYAFSLFCLEGLEIGQYKRLRFEESAAVVQLKKALILDPDDAMIHVYLGLKCYKNQRNAEAWEYMTKALTMAPDNLSVVLRVAKFMKKEQSYDRALEVLLRMLEKAPESSRLHHEIANNYRWKAMQLEDIHNPVLLRLCIQHLEKGASLNPGFIYPQLELALRYADIKQYAKAEQKFRELFALDLKPNDLQAWHRKYGDFQLYKLGSEAAAVEHYKQGMMLGRVSTEWINCRNRLKKVLWHDRRDAYQIRMYLDSFSRENNGDTD
ncbi:interferon-induced protein with tetratricopeptide repeats 8 [Myxocyprinus asiaticus]|uniref:interferon-induced protein with tetratricopeptide repeats 8 n=1 Tax=Myxocyprinus asiaticus TaxID=70543 RepID=UPI002221B420|nr:interferon-induced protein with tetratricopeptide repeats 8 [Myxocyprinus asiaticus]XP_051507292.1 interferon-induced protein with tetratricopeptide repeats 8 [Myxocyprinus asiaticus]